MKRRELWFAAGGAALAVVVMSLVFQGERQPSERESFNARERFTATYH